METVPQSALNAFKSYQRRSGFVIVILLSLASFAAGQKPSKSEPPLKLKIVDLRGNPVACALHRVAPAGTMELVGHSDAQNPVVTIPDGCKAGFRLIFIPDDGSIYYRDSRYCPYKQDTFVVQLISGDESKRLAKSLVTLTNNDPANAVTISFVALEIAARTEKKSIKEAYEIASYVEAGKFFNTNTAVSFDSGQKKVVPSTELETKVKEFQEDKGLKATGTLDYPTYRAATGLTTNDLFEMRL